MRALCFILTLFVFCSTAFSFEVKPVNSSYLRWNTAEQNPVLLQTAANRPSYISAVQFQSNLAAAANEWNLVPGQSLRFALSGTVADAAVNNTDFKNTVVWVNDWKYSNSVVAVTRYSYYMDKPQQIIDSDILLNRRDFKWTAGAATDKTVNLKDALVHELGHMIGLSHTSVVNASLYPYLRSHSTTALVLDDKAAARFLYGAAEPGFKPATPVTNSIYPVGMAKRQLPLPVFRWTPGPSSGYVLEFSGSQNFSKKFVINAGGQTFHQLTTPQETKLIALSPLKKIFWRVRSGQIVTPARTLSFR